MEPGIKLLKVCKVDWKLKIRYFYTTMAISKLTEQLLLSLCWRKRVKKTYYGTFLILKIIGIKKKCLQVYPFIPRDIFNGDQSYVLEFA